MARPKIDGIIEAVRYSSDGKIAFARGYERRGLVWSDNVLITRDELLQMLKQGRHLVTGVRKAYLGGVFDTGPEIHVQNDYILAGSKADGCDKLDGAATF